MRGMSVFTKVAIPEYGLVKYFVAYSLAASVSALFLFGKTAVSVSGAFAALFFMHITHGSNGHDAAKPERGRPGYAPRQGNTSQRDQGIRTPGGGFVDSEMGRKVAAG